MLWISTENRVFSVDSITQDGNKLYFCQATGKGIELIHTLEYNTSKEAQNEKIRISGALCAALKLGKHSTIVGV